MISQARRLDYLDAMGVQVWQERGKKPTLLPDSSLPELSAVEDLTALSSVANASTRCEASTQRRQVIFGEGAPQADWLIIGDYPSEQDDSDGRLFSDSRGHLLSAMLLAVGIKKPDAYLTSSAKCHSKNETVQSDSLSSCRDILIRQIELMNPKIILLLGEKSARSVLQSKEGLRELRGKVQTIADINCPIVVTHDLNHLIETPLAKKEAWADIQLARHAAE